MLGCSLEHDQIELITFIIRIAKQTYHILSILCMDYIWLFSGFIFGYHLICLFIVKIFI